MPDTVEAPPLAPSTWWGTLLSAAVLLDREKRSIPETWRHPNLGHLCVPRLLEHTLWPHGLVAHPVPPDGRSSKPYWEALTAFTATLDGADPCTWEQWHPVGRIVVQLRRAVGLDVPNG